MVPINVCVIIRGELAIGRIFAPHTSLVPTCVPLTNILYDLNLSEYPVRLTTLSMQVAPADIDVTL